MHQLDAGLSSAKGIKLLATYVEVRRCKIQNIKERTTMLEFTR